MFPREASYDEVVEKTLLSNTFFTNTLPLLERRTSGVARRVFIDLLTSNTLKHEFSTDASNYLSIEQQTCNFIELSPQIGFVLYPRLMAPPRLSALERSHLLPIPMGY